MELRFVFKLRISVGIGPGIKKWEQLEAKSWSQEWFSSTYQLISLRFLLFQVTGHYTANFWVSD